MPDEGLPCKQALLGKLLQAYCVNSFLIKAKEYTEKNEDNEALNEFFIKND